MRDHIFRSVELLIYVFDIESEEEGNDFSQYVDVVEALEQHSPDARVYVLVHKMDLVKDEARESIFMDKRASILSQTGGQLRISFFRTSIWDETLYRAWSHIVYSLVPNTALLESNLNAFCAQLKALTPVCGCPCDVRLASQSHGNCGRYHLCYYVS